MGMTHYKAMAQVEGGQVAAIVSRDPKKRAGDWRDIQGNFGDSGEEQDLSGIRCYETLDELCARSGDRLGGYLSADDDARRDQHPWR